MALEASLKIEVAYALADEQIVAPLNVPAGTTVQEAIRLSGLAAHYPDIQYARAGIYGRQVAPDTVLADGDRVEIYRPLRTDSKQARQRRAARRLSALFAGCVDRSLRLGHFARVLAVRQIRALAGLGIGGGDALAGLQALQVTLILFAGLPTPLGLGGLLLRLRLGFLLLDLALAKIGLAVSERFLRGRLAWSRGRRCPSRSRRLRRCL